MNLARNGCDLALRAARSGNISSAGTFNHSFSIMERSGEILGAALQVHS